MPVYVKICQFFLTSTPRVHLVTFVFQYSGQTIVSHVIVKTYISIAPRAHLSREITRTKPGNDVPLSLHAVSMNM